jgi:hypothetical protein
MEWTISIEGRNEFGDVCRREVRINKSEERLRDGDLGLSIDDGKKIMVVLQKAVVTQAAESYALFRRVCPDCHTFRPVKDYTIRQIRKVFGTVEVRNPRWTLCADCHPGMVAAFAPLKEICPDRGDARTNGTDGAAGKHDALPAGCQRACRVLASRTDTQLCASGRSEPASGSISRSWKKPGAQDCRRTNDDSSKCSFLGIGGKSSSSASTRLMFAAPIGIQHETSRSS